MEEYTRPLNERDKKIIAEMKIVEKLRKEEGCKLLDCNVVTNNINLRIEIIDLKREMQEQEKIIELMAKDIAENKLDEDICRQVKNLKKEECYACTYDGKDCSECVIEYYEKKAKEAK